MKSLFNKIFNQPSKEVSIYETIFPFNNIKKFIEDNNLRMCSVETHKQNDSEETKYDPTTRKINIPKNFLKTTENEKLIKEAEKFYGKDTLDTIIAHEFGHSIHHRFLLTQEISQWSIGKNGDICLTKVNSYNKEADLATEFFKANNRIPNGIERFMQQNFMESYADIYSGLIVYLKNDTKDIFDKIIKYRNLDSTKVKKDQELSINNDNQVLMGKFATTQYFNFHGIQKFRDNFITNFDKEDILNIAKKNFEAIHHIIQIEALDGLYKTMKEEAKNNNLFLLELKDFCQTRHNCSINTFFDKFESHLTNLRIFYCKYEPINTLDNNAPYFDYDTNCSQLSQNSIIQQYRKTLLKDDLIKFDDANISKLNLNTFNEHYAQQYSNYKLNLDTNNKIQINQTILNLREKFIEQKIQDRELKL